MQTWKMFIRSAGVVTVLTAGAFAAGQAVVPFANASRGVDPAVEEPAPDPVVDPAEEAPETDDSTTTTTEPEAPATDETPEADEPADDPVDDPAPAEAPEESADDVTPVDINAVPSAPVADPAPKAVKETKVQKDRNWDHNCDGRADNGWRKKSHEWLISKGRNPCTLPGPTPIFPTAPAPQDPAPAPAPAAENKGRSESAPGHTKSNDRPASAPGQMKKNV